MLQGRGDGRCTGEEGRRGRGIWEQPEDHPHGLGSALPEHHPGSHAQVLRVLDELEPANGLVSGSYVVPVHGDDGGCLPRAPAVYCGVGRGRVMV